MINLFKIIKRCIQSKSKITRNNGVFFSGRERNTERDVKVASPKFPQEHRQRVPKKMCNNSVHFSGRERNTERITKATCPKAQESHQRTEEVTARPNNEIRTSIYEEGGHEESIKINHLSQN